jgi:hypothetical protein
VFYPQPPPGGGTKGQLSGLVLTNQGTPGTLSGPANVTFPNGLGNVWAITYVISALQGLNTLWGYYSNFHGPGTYSSITIPSYSSGTPPSADASYNLTPVLFSYNGMTLILYPPSESNTGQSTGVTVTSFLSSYSTPGASKRYPNPLSQPTQTTTISNTITYLNGYTNPSPASFTYAYSNLLYPGSTYTFTLAATNSLGQSAANPTSVTINTPTNYPPMTITKFSPAGTTLGGSPITPGTNLYPVQYPAAGAITSNLYNNTAVPTNAVPNLSLMYSPTPLNPNTSTTYIGIDSSGQTLLVASATFGSIGAAVTYKGFSTIGSTDTSANMTVLNSGGSVGDQYASPQQNQGFYSYVQNLAFQINTSALTPRTAIYVLVLQTIYSTPSAPPSPTASTLNFYFDSLTAASPTFVSSTYSINSGQTTPVSGINVVGIPTVTFAADTSLNNLANCFYRSPLLTYTFSGGVNASLQESDLSKCTKQTPPLTGTVAFNNNSLATTNAGTCTSTTILTLVAQNINNQTGPQTSTLTNNPILYDRPSYLLITNTSYTPVSIIM